MIPVFEDTAMKEQNEEVQQMSLFPDHPEDWEGGDDFMSRLQEYSASVPSQGS